MENAKKQLREGSLLVLFFAALSLVRMIFDALTIYFTDAKNVPVEGVTQDIVTISSIAFLVVGIICLIPQVFVGLRGLKIAKEPAATKGHIVWARILMIISIVALVSIIPTLFEPNADLVNGIFGAVDCILDVVVFGLFIKYANAVYTAFTKQ